MTLLRLLPALFMMMVITKHQTHGYPNNAASDAWEEGSAARSASAPRPLATDKPNPRPKASDAANRIVCPVLSAMYMYGDLWNAHGKVTPENPSLNKAWTIASFLRVGISHRNAVGIAKVFNHPTIRCTLPGRETGGLCEDKKSPYKCPQCPDEHREIHSVFDMNTLQKPGYLETEHSALEHFRSTGWRDTVDPIGLQPQPNHALFDASVAEEVKNGVLDVQALYRIINKFDHNIPGHKYRAADVNPIKKCDGVRNSFLNVGHSGGEACCGPSDSVKTPEKAAGDKCFSQMYGANSFLFEEFGSPPNRQWYPQFDGNNPTKFALGQYRGMILDSVYPDDFWARSPRHCMQVDTDPLVDDNCGGCYDEYSKNSRSVTVFLKETMRQRLCRCMAPMQDPPGDTRQPTPGGDFLRSLSPDRMEVVRRICKPEVDVLKLGQIQNDAGL